jgi:Xaa-Pro dipeptidase
VIADLHGRYAEHLRVLTAGYGNALAAHGYDAVVIHGGVARKRSEYDDQYWSLRPTPHFQHWVPVSEPDAALVFRAGETPVLARVPCTSFWEAPPPPESSHFLDHVTALTLTAADDLKAHLPGGRVAFVGEDLAQAGRWGFDPAHCNPAGLLTSLDALRTRKTAYERACLAEANRRAAPGHLALRDVFLAGPCTELDLHLAYLRATAQDDAETPYKNIVALDRNAATLHHIAYARGASRRATALLVDAGATCLGYCSDITRTWVRSDGSDAATRFAALVSGLEALQRDVCARVRPGDGYESLHDGAHDALGALLAALGVVTCSGEEAVRAGVTRVFLPHGLGHSLGLQCHDVGCAVVKPRGDNPFLRNTSVIESGQVFTIEPGAYFIEGLIRPLREGPHAGLVNWPLVDALAPFGGVRIEDDVVVTGDPARPLENLTRDALGD